MSQQHNPGYVPGGGIDLSGLAQQAQRAANPGADGMRRDVNGAPQGGQVVDVPALVLEANDQTFNQVAPLSQVVPVVVELFSHRSAVSAQLGALLEEVTIGFGGRLLLVRVDADANPGIVQAFQAGSVPSVFALVNGQPVPLFQEAIDAEQAQKLFEQLLVLGQQQGVSGRVTAPGVDGEAAEPAPKPLPPKHQEAFDAIERGDYPAAVAAYTQALNKNPRDDDARAGLAQVNLLLRLQGKTLEDIRARAAAEPESLEALLDIADLDVSGGHVEDGFLRLLEGYSTFVGDDQVTVRDRLVELFEVVGHDDPRVALARRKLATLLF